MAMESPTVVDTLPEILRRFGLEFDGWYAESAEGVLTPYEESATPPSEQDVEDLAA